MSLSMLASCSAVGGAGGVAWSCDWVVLVDSTSGEGNFNTQHSSPTIHTTCSAVKHEFQFGPHSLCRSLSMASNTYSVSGVDMTVHVRHTISLYPGMSFDQSLQIQFIIV